MYPKHEARWLSNAEREAHRGSPTLLEEKNINKNNTKLNFVMLSIKLIAKWQIHLSWCNLASYHPTLLAMFGGRKYRRECDKLRNLVNSLELQLSDLKREYFAYAKKIRTRLFWSRIINLTLLSVVVILLIKLGVINVISVSWDSLEPISFLVFTILIPMYIFLWKL